MHHNIPHRFVTGLNSRATKCAVCLGSIHFVKQAAKCAECNMVCHPRCVANLPATCGLPTEYARHFTDMMTRARGLSAKKISVADLKLHMNGWMKMPRPGKQIWEKKWVELRNNKIHIYENNNTDDLEPIDDFDLCPINGEVTVHSAVSPTELTSTASSDLPYVLRLEFEPDTTCWPGRSLYMLALTFTEKQKWVATLEAIVNTRSKSHTTHEPKVFGNLLAKIPSGARPTEINCSWPFNDEVVLVGTDDGLYALQLHRTPQDQPLIKIAGLDAVHMISGLRGLDVVVFVTGKERDLVFIDVGSLGHCLSQGLKSGRDPRASFQPEALEGITTVTTFVLGSCSSGTYLCAATADKMFLLKYSSRQGTFAIKKEMLIKQAVSCMHFGEDYILLGSDRFYTVDLHSFTLTEFLNRQDTSLAYALFGAAHHDSFPVAALQVAPSGEEEEYLLCFHDFGVFVDNQGCRTRQDDLRWSGLPLAFAYEEPFLYAIHFNCLQIQEIRPTYHETPLGQKSHVFLTTPRYLGPAMTAGAIYVASTQEDTTQITCFRGNLAAHAADEGSKENVASYSVPKTKHSHSGSKRKIQPVSSKTSSTTESGFVSPDEASPFVLSTLSRSPPKRSRHPSESSQASSAIIEEKDVAVSSVKLRAALLERQMRGLAPDTSADSESDY